MQGIKYDEVKLWDVELDIGLTTSVERRSCPRGAERESETPLVLSPKEQSETERTNRQEYAKISPFSSDVEYTVESFLHRHCCGIQDGPECGSSLCYS